MLNPFSQFGAVEPVDVNTLLSLAFVKVNPLITSYFHRQQS